MGPTARHGAAPGGTITEQWTGRRMRITGGRWAGRNLDSPGGRVRPTAEEVRDRWMDALREDLPGARVLDLFAGSGALGLEALSRGGAAADFVEWGGGALHALKANVTGLGVRPRCRIFKRDAVAFAAALEPLSYDIVLADPPYTSRLAVRLVEMWQERPFSRILAVEHPLDLTLPRGEGGFVMDPAGVTIYRAPPGRTTGPGPPG